MQPTFLETREPMRFYEFPSRVIISVKPELDFFLHQTGLKADSQEHHEVTRQIFDCIDFGYHEFNNLLRGLPIFKLLSSFAVDPLKYTDINGLPNNLSLNLKAATVTYGVSIYMTCVKVGIFDGDKTPYILETVQNDLCVLHNSFTNMK